MNQISEGVKNLLIINVVVFVLGMILNRFSIDLALNYPAYETFKPFQLVTNIFAHATPKHLLYNMLTLYFVGPFVEMMLGSKNFIKYYLICGFGAVAVYLLAETYLYAGSPHPSVLGASGAIYGCLIFFLIYFWNKDMSLFLIPIQVKGWMLFLLFFGPNIYFAITGARTGTAHWAHLGGALTGVIYMLTTKRL